MKDLRLDHGCKLYRISHAPGEEFSEWTLIAMPDVRTIPKGEGFWLVEAIGIPKVEGTRLYMDLSTPERINDFTYQVMRNTLTRVPTHEIQGTAVPALASEEFGLYELYYSKKDPSVGIAVLREGLKHAKDPVAIAEDLGYILRDEGRAAEAIEAFDIAILHGASSSFITRERDQLRAGLSPIQVSQLPDHESGVRRMVSDALGAPYTSFKSLEEARACTDGAVILEGDDGGQIYLVWPVSLVNCSEDTLEGLLQDLDRIAWACNAGEGARVHFEKRPVGSPVAGGMGGGTVGPQGWIHEEFRKLGLEKNIREVLAGTRDCIRP